MHETLHVDLIVELLDPTKHPRVARGISIATESLLAPSPQIGLNHA